MVSVPKDLLDKLRRSGQDHVLAWWGRLTDQARRERIDQLQVIDLEQLERLYAGRDENFALPAADRIAPVPVAQLDPRDRQTGHFGEEALRRGEVAALVVAGGQGSRLGFEHPKGMFPIGPVTNKSLSHHHASKVLALS